jgi:hypothetical protein
MYRNVALTILVILTAIVALELARAPRALPAPTPEDETAFEANRRVLETRIAELNLHNTTVGEAIERIRQATHIPFAVNWESLEKLRDRPIDAELHDVALGDAVQFVLCLDQYDASQFPLPQADFDVVNGTLIIGGPRRGSSAPNNFPPRALRMRMYDVRDLLAEPYWGYRPNPKQAAERSEDRAQALGWLVQSEAGMKNWDISHRPGSFNGFEPGGFASLNVWAGRLFVVQTTYGHMRIEAFLARLRSLKQGEK